MSNIWEKTKNGLQKENKGEHFTGNQKYAKRVENSTGANAQRSSESEETTQNMSVPLSLVQKKSQVCSAFRAKLKHRNISNCCPK